MRREQNVVVFVTILPLTFKEIWGTILNQNIFQVLFPISAQNVPWPLLLTKHIWTTSKEITRRTENVEIYTKYRMYSISILNVYFKVLRFSMRWILTSTFRTSGTEDMLVLCVIIVKRAWSMLEIILNPSTFQIHFYMNVLCVASSLEQTIPF